MNTSQIIMAVCMGCTNSSCGMVSGTRNRNVGHCELFRAREMSDE
jgi:hypothetical protein